MQFPQGSCRVRRSSEGFFAEERSFVTSSGAGVCRVLPFASVCCWFHVCRVFIALVFAMPPLSTVATLAVVFLTRVFSAGLVSSLLLIVAILLGIILRSSLGNRLDKSILLVLLGEEKLLLTEFVITVEIVASSEV